MLLVGITTVVLFCLFIGVQTTLSIITLVIVIGLAAHCPALLIFLCVALIAQQISKKR